MGLSFLQRMEFQTNKCLYEDKQWIQTGCGQKGPPQERRERGLLCIVMLHAQVNSHMWSEALHTGPQAVPGLFFCHKRSDHAKKNLYDP